MLFFKKLDLSNFCIQQTSDINHMFGVLKELKELICDDIKIKDEFKNNNQN